MFYEKKKLKNLHDKRLSKNFKARLVNITKALDLRLISEAVAWRCSLKKVFFKILQKQLC